jgi:glycosyltransferase involved in cell wall biosynthesis
LAKKTKLAIFVSTFNQMATTLTHNLWFIQDQTYKDFICVIGDDQSTDDTQEYCEKFCKEDKRFIYHRTPTKYVRNSLFYNWAAKEYKTEYIITCDGDNYLSTNAAEIRLETIERMPKNSTVYSDSLVCFWNPSKTKIVDQYVRGREWDLNWYVYHTCFNNYIDMCDIIFNRQCYLDVGGYFAGGLGYQDYSIMIRLAMKYQNQIYHIPQVLTQYNSFADSQAKTMDVSEESRMNIFANSPKEWQL